MPQLHKALRFSPLSPRCCSSQRRCRARDVAIHTACHRLFSKSIMLPWNGVVLLTFIWVCGTVTAGEPHRTSRYTAGGGWCYSVDVATLTTGCVPPAGADVLRASAGPVDKRTGGCTRPQRLFFTPCWLRRCLPFRFRAAVAFFFRR